MVCVGIGNLSSRSRIEFQYSCHSRLESLGIHTGLGHYAVEVFLCELVEIGGDYDFGIIHHGCRGQGIQLNEQTLPQIPRADSSRFKGLNHLYHLLHFFLRCIYAGPESHLIHKTVGSAAKVTVIIQTIYYIVGNLGLMVAQISELELFGEILGERFLH